MNTRRDRLALGGLERQRRKWLKLTVDIHAAEQLKVHKVAWHGCVRPEQPDRRRAWFRRACAGWRGGAKRGRRVFDAIVDHGIICDWREPDIIRIAPAPLYNRFMDIFEFVEELTVALKEIA